MKENDCNIKFQSQLNKTEAATEINTFDDVVERTEAIDAL